MIPTYVYNIQKIVKTVMFSLIESFAPLTQRVFVVTDLTNVDFLICIAYSCASRIIPIVICDYPTIVTVYNIRTFRNFNSVESLLSTDGNV